MSLGISRDFHSGSPQVFIQHRQLLAAFHAISRTGRKYPATRVSWLGHRDADDGPGLFHATMENRAVSEPVKKAEWTGYDSSQPW
jgi:hypothetical protein